MSWKWWPVGLPWNIWRKQIQDENTRDRTVSLFWSSSSIGSHLDCIFVTNIILMTIRIEEKIQSCYIELGPPSSVLTVTLHDFWKLCRWTRNCPMVTFGVVGMWFQLCSSGYIYERKRQRMTLVWVLIITRPQKKILLHQLLFVVIHSELNSTVGIITGIRKNRKFCTEISKTTMHQI